MMMIFSQRVYLYRIDDDKSSHFDFFTVQILLYFKQYLSPTYTQMIISSKQQVFNLFVFAYGSIVLRIGDVCVNLRHFNANILMAKLILHNRTYLFHVFQIFQPRTQAAFVFLVSKVLFRSSICFNFSRV